MKKSIKQDILDILKETRGISEEKKTELLNTINAVFSGYKEPVSQVIWVPINRIMPNSYNPNKMATPEKRLLLRSLVEHGITMPLVVCAEKEQHYTLIDGYHRWSLIKRNSELLNRLGHKVPVVVLDLPNNDRMVATIRHNRARGRHQIGEISEVVKILSTTGWPPSKIMDALGMDADEVLRLKQFKGLGEMFQDGDYSTSWQ